MTMKTTPFRALLSALVVSAVIVMPVVQAQTADASNAETAKTETIAEAEAKSDASTPPADDKTDNKSEKEAPTTPVDSPQVQKLMALYPELVARIRPVGRVCFAGEECDINIVVAANADGSPREGRDVYNAVCQTCHASGLIGAPKVGDKGAWASRIAQGKDTLYKHAIGGYNKMPPKGGADIPDEEVKNAVDFLVEQAS